MQILPGSANLIGGRCVTVKNVPARSVQAMKFPGAPYGLKMACGENPKRVYGEQGRAPSTRMGNVAGYRQAWIEAGEYRREWDEYRRTARARTTRTDMPPERDLEMETLAGVLAGEILVQNHCYRADEMVVMIDIAREFGYKIAAFHHAVEAYKIADVLAREGHLLRHLGRLVGLQDGGPRRHPRERRDAAEGRRLRGRSTPTRPRASSGSTRRPPRPWPPATAWA